MKKNFIVHYPLIFGLISFFPAVVFAQGEIDRLVNTTLKNTLNTVVGVLFVIATVVFLWGVIQFIAKSGDEAGRAKAKGIMTWGIVGIAVMAAAWGVTALLVSYSTAPGGVSIPRLPGGLQ